MAAGPDRQQHRSAHLARPLKPRRALAVTTVLVLLLHALALALLSSLLRPPSLLKTMATPFYTRSIAPEVPAVVAAAPAPMEIKPDRPTALIRPARAATKNKAKTNPKPSQGATEATDVAPESATEPPEVTAQAPDTPASAASPAVANDQTTAAAVAEASAAPPAAEPVAAASAAPAASAPSAGDAPFLASWPSDTRLTYKLGGNYRGELHGSARVLWQREGTRYHTAVEMSAGLLASLSFTSQGDITEGGLKPEVYEENVRGRRRGVRLGEDVRLNNGDRIARPEAVQDTASQFVELGHRFSTGQVKLVPGAQVNFSMARPGGIDEWTYDVIGEETLHLPRLGPVPTLHLKPRPLSKPRGPISAEIWYAPSLQYLPVRIRITQGNDNYIDLMVDTIEQR